MKKYGTCKLLAGLILLIVSCNTKQPTLLLRTVKHLPRFPSASAIEYSNGRLYLFGDDAPYTLILDAAFNPLDTIRFLPDTTYRIDKATKPDIESATIVINQDVPVLVGFGSLSNANRLKGFAFPISNPHGVESLPMNDLLQALPDLKDLNIEGAAFANGNLVLANRAHLNNRVNHLLVMDAKAQKLAAARPITMHINHKNVIGLSGLYYVAAKDRLLFTASEEATASTDADGAIGNSYLGWIDNFSKQMQQQVVRPDGMIPLQTVNSQLIRQKIESVCAIRITKDSASLVLAADNDDGQSTLFAVTMYD
jgi:hypothetical protein